MADQSNIHSLALQDILLSIADSLNQAQQQLNNVSPYDQYGRPSTMYHLPYLDFTLKVFTEFEVESSEAPNTNSGVVGTGSSTVVNSSTNNKANKMNGAIGQQLVKSNLLKFTPVTASNVAKNSNNTTQIESTISGRFVAVVPNEGQAQLVLNCQSTAPILKSGNNNRYEFMINVQVKNALNESISNAMVEVNFDAVESLNINGSAISLNPVFSINEGLTNAQGLFSTKVEISSADYNNNKIFFFTINTSNIFQHLSVSKV